MRSIAVSDLRANLSKILKDIEDGTSINITYRGKEIAKLVPPDIIRDEARKKLEQIAKSAQLNDVISPIW